MRRIGVVLLAFCALLLPTAARADAIPAWLPSIVNEFGTVTITDAGIFSKGSELKNFYGITAPQGHSLGSVSFSTGPLTSGSIFGGGTFSSYDSTFDVIGVGRWAKKLTGQSSSPVALFTGSFVGPIQWKLVSHTGEYEYVFTLRAEVNGTLWNGRIIYGSVKQTIYLNENQWARDHQGRIGLGSAQFKLSPEPGTLGLLATGLLAVVAMRRKIFGF